MNDVLVDLGSTTTPTLEKSCAARPISRLLFRPKPTQRKCRLEGAVLAGAQAHDAQRRPLWVASAVRGTAPGMNPPARPTRRLFSTENQKNAPTSLPAPSTNPPLAFLRAQFKTR